MKKSFCFALFCACLFQITTAAALPVPQSSPEVKIIVSARRIWLIADEMPVKCLTVQVYNAAGKVVLEQKFSSKTSDWSLDLAKLPAGDYSVVAGTQAPIRFSR